MSRGKLFGAGLASSLAIGLAMAPLMYAQPVIENAAPVPGAHVANDNMDAVVKRLREEVQSIGQAGVVEVVTEDDAPAADTPAPVDYRPLPAPGVGLSAPASPYPPPGRSETPFYIPHRQSPYTGVLLAEAKKAPTEQKAPVLPEPSNQPTTTAPTQPSSFDYLGLGKAPTLSTSQAANATTSTTNIAGGVNQAVTASGSTSDLLAKSNSAVGVEVQKRSSFVGDPRIQGFHFGQIITQADGGYWFPARVDLDTVVSKLNSDSISNILIVKGPFSVRYGPGFSFLDIESLPTPRSQNGAFEAHGSTALNYRTNAGQQATQNIWGGGSDWGFRLSYDALSSNDYFTGAGIRVPSAYNNQFLNMAYGVDLSKTESVEVRYMHVQQSNVLFPGLLTNINSLTTDAFTGRYVATEGTWYDRFVLETWINYTTFDGDSANQQTRNQIPQLNDIFPASIAANQPIRNAFGPVRLDITTNGDALSWGFREITTWGDLKGFNVSLGADLRVFQNRYDEFDAFNLSVASGTAGTRGFAANLGIPNARMIDPGIFIDSSVPLGEDLLVKLGLRTDFASTQFLNFGPNVDTTIYNQNVPNAQGTKDFFMFSGFVTGERKLSDKWTMQTGYGYAQRPPTLTELYTGGSFLGLIQNGLNSISGNPNLRKEQLHQLDFSIKAAYETFRLGTHAFYAFAPDYITFENRGPFQVRNINANGVPVTGTTQLQQFRFINTDRATLWGVDGYVERDTLPWLTPFATLSYVQAWDHSRDEALPGIPPLATRVGVRFHEAGENQRWGIEYFARMVAEQNLFAASLAEQRTAGFVIHNIRAYWQARENILLLGGIENIGNFEYREHLDLRTGNPPGYGVFQPGINFYVGTKITY